MMAEILFYKLPGVTLGIGDKHSAVQKEDIPFTVLDVRCSIAIQSRGGRNVNYPWQHVAEVCVSFSPDSKRLTVVQWVRGHNRTF
jgi:hypothetical protein